MEIQIKQALKKDCDFIAKIILFAESTGTETTTYQKMFDMDSKELLPIFAQIINNEKKGHSLTYTSYYIASINNKQVGAISAYIEGEHGSSNHLLTGALMSGFNREVLQESFRFLAKNRELHLEKTTGSLQIDSVATLANFSGKGVFSKLLKTAEEAYKKLGVSNSEIQVWKKNVLAIKTYEAKGYIQALESEKINGKIIMTKEL